jgi:ABC-type sugar transport system ATPase subunit
MEEIEQIADRITVLRDGNHIDTSLAADLPTPKLIQMMVGRTLDQQFPRHQPHIGASRLEIEDFTVFSRDLKERPVVERVSLQVRAGEILGIGGLQGSGASQLLMGLFGGYGHATQGRVRLNGLDVQIRSPRQAIRSGIALLTNDRKATGLVLSMSIIANMTLADMLTFSPNGIFKPAQERQAAEALGKALHLRAASLEMEVAALSGGNQQKVAMAKWLQVKPQVLLLDEPTRGIDVGSKHEIYQLMNEWTAEGIAIILITSEMPELLAMSDRIAVMHRGQKTAEFTRAEATPELILEVAMGKMTKPNK